MVFTPFTPDDLPSMANFNEKLQALFDGSTKIEIGEYVGDGKTHKSLSNMKTLHFQSRPKAVLISPSGVYQGYSFGNVLWLYEQTTGLAWINNYAANSKDLTLVWNDNKLSWFGSGPLTPNATWGPYFNLNASGQTYRYIVIY